MGGRVGMNEGRTRQEGRKEGKVNGGKRGEAEEQAKGRGDK